MGVRKGCGQQAYLSEPGNSSDVYDGDWELDNRCAVCDIQLHGHTATWSCSYILIELHAQTATCSYSYMLILLNAHAATYLYCCMLIQLHAHKCEACSARQSKVASSHLLGLLCYTVQSAPKRIA